MRRTLLLSALWLVLACPAAWGAAPFALLSPERLALLPARASSSEGKSVLRAAQAAWQRRPSPLPVIHVEGTLPHQGIHDQSALAKKDWDLLRDLGLAFALTNDQRYLDQAQVFLEAWLGVYRPSYNPIDETGLSSLILAWDCTRAALPAATNARMSAFWRQLATGYLDSMASQRRPDVGNWQSHRVKLVVLAAYALGDQELLAQARAAFGRQVAVNINPDGSVWDYYQRDALHYVVYDLEPLTWAAVAARAHGEDWLTWRAPQGGSLRLALEWLRPYAEGRLSHQEFVNSKIRFDYTRRDAGIKGFAGAWEPKNAAQLYWLAAQLDHGYLSLARSLAEAPGSWLRLCFH